MIDRSHGGSDGDGERLRAPDGVDDDAVAVALLDPSARYFLFHNLTSYPDYQT